MKRMMRMKRMKRMLRMMRMRLECLSQLARAESLLPRGASLRGRGWPLRSGRRPRTSEGRARGAVWRSWANFRRGQSARIRSSADPRECGPRPCLSPPPRGSVERTGRTRRVVRARARDARVAEAGGWQRRERGSFQTRTRRARAAPETVASSLVVMMVMVLSEEADATQRKARRGVCEAHRRSRGRTGRRVLERASVPCDGARRTDPRSAETRCASPAPARAPGPRGTAMSMSVATRMATRGGPRRTRDERLPSERWHARPQGGAARVARRPGAPGDDGERQARAASSTRCRGCRAGGRRGV